MTAIKNQKVRYLLSIILFHFLFPVFNCSNFFTEFESQRLTRLKVNQISNGTLLFKLGNDSGFRNYVNQYTVNPMALNKPQRNEERDKKRHLAHKFSLTCSQEFKWSGHLNGKQYENIF